MTRDELADKVARAIRSAPDTVEVDPPLTLTVRLYDECRVEVDWINIRQEFAAEQ